MWTTLRCISIGPSPTIDILSMGYPPMFSSFRQPSEPLSLDSSHALTPILLGCFSAYGMHVCQFQYSLIHMQIYKHEYTRIIQITQSCYAILQLNIKISSLGLMIKREQFNLNHSTKHIFSQNYTFVSLFLGTVKP